MDPAVFLSSVVALGAFAQWIAWHFRLPSILLLLAFGFGARIITGIDPIQVLGEDLLFAIVSLFVAVILFEGGLSLKLAEVRESKTVVFRLVTVGVLVTWVLAAICACLILDMDWRIAALVGAVFTVTGPTVVGPLLRHIRPTRNVAAIIKWEGIVVDPIGALLAVLVFEVIFEPMLEAGTSGSVVSPWLIAGILMKTIFVGAGIAIVTAYGLSQALKRYFIPDYLHGYAFLAIAIGTFTASNQLQHESGLVTVTLLGVLLANQSVFPVKHVVQFKENLRDLLISTLFIVLAARIDLDQLMGLGSPGLAFVVLLILLIRPLAVYASCIGSGMNWREQTFLGFLAPRGIVAAAVASVFALEVEQVSSVDVFRGAEAIVPLTFLVIVGTVTTYGLASPVLARLLNLAAPNPQGVLFAGASAWVRAVASAIQDAGFRVLLVDTNFRNVSAARQNNIPAVCASVLSEFVDEEVDLGGLGRMLAVTPNDDLNRLASLEFSHDFGSANVYQLATKEERAGERRQTSSDRIQGRKLFGSDSHFTNIASRFEQGATVKKTRLTAEFTLQDFFERHGDSAMIMFVVTRAGKLKIVTADGCETGAGDLIVALVDPASDG
jgi:NhaP-type Na+/H+ or K+/H+ antiporter